MNPNEQTMGQRQHFDSNCSNQQWSNTFDQQPVYFQQMRKSYLLYKNHQWKPNSPQSMQEMAIKAPGDKSWDNAVTHFRAEAKDQKLKKSTGMQGLVNRATQLEEEMNNDKL